MKISLVISTCNEQETLPVFYECIRGRSDPGNYDIEMVFVSDGSSDD